MRDENRKLVEVNPLEWDDDSAMLEEHRRNMQAKADGTEQNAEKAIEALTSTEGKKHHCSCGGCCG